METNPPYTILKKSGCTQTLKEFVQIQVKMHSEVLAATEL